MSDFPKYDDLDLEGKVRKINAEFFFMKNQIEQQRKVISALIDGYARLCQTIPGAITEAASELQDLRFEFDKNGRSIDEDYYRRPK